MKNNNFTVITAGMSYFDFDAHAWIVAAAELFQMKGERVIAYSNAPRNYSICQSLVREVPIARSLPLDVSPKNAAYIIVDVSDPDFLKDSVPLDQVTAIYDHHTGFETYWQSRIGENAHIEFIGAAATLIYREWKKAGLQERMSDSTAKLLIAAILDNTLNLTSSNTTPEDIETFNVLCRKADVGAAWCAAYFSEVQKSVEADLENALFNDVKNLQNNPVLPSHMAQLCVWDASSILLRLQEIRQWFQKRWDSWLINIIDIQHRCGYFVCDEPEPQKELEKLFGIQFEKDIAKLPVPYLRKEIIKKTKSTS